MVDNPTLLNRWTHKVALASALVLALVASDAISTPSVTVANVPLPVTGNIDATITLPAEPFSAEMEFTAAGTAGAKAVGLPGRRLAISAITITNRTDHAQDLFLF